MATVPEGRPGAADVVDDVTEIVAYERPPVVEVVAAVRFTPLPTPLAMSLGEFWRIHLRDEFPGVSEQAPYSAPVESFDRPLPLPAINFEFGQQPPLPRMWWTRGDGSELLQVQRDWFACNWRRAGPEAQYARWGSRRHSFRQRYGQLAEWAQQRGHTLQAEQCEVTYINHLMPGGIWRSHADAHKLFTSVNESPLPSGVTREDTRFQERYLVMGIDGSSRARLHARVEPAYSRDDDRPIFVFDLTVRGKPASSDPQGVIEMLDLGREIVVQAFAQLTTPEAAEEWGRLL